MAGPLLGRGVESPPGGDPPLPVTFVWPDRNTGRMGVCHMPWRRGCTVKTYLHTQPLRDHPILGMWRQCKAYNRKKAKVRLSYIPEPGDAVVLVRVGRRA